MTGLFGQKPTALPPAPAPQPPATMPDPGSPDVLAAKRREQQDILSRAGRSSTILTAPKSASPDYTATKLGSAA